MTTTTAAAAATEAEVAAKATINTKLCTLRENSNLRLDRDIPPHILQSAVHSFLNENTYVSFVFCSQRTLQSYNTQKKYYATKPRRASNS